MTQESPIRPKTPLDATEIVYETVDGRIFRTVFEPRSGDGPSHERIKYQWTGDHWRQMGSEPVELIEAPGGSDR